MSKDCPDVLIWPLDEPWPTSLLPPPTLMLELSVVELDALIEDYGRMAAEGHARHNHELGACHEARASYLRQRLAAAAPHKLTLDRQGRA